MGGQVDLSGLDIPLRWASNHDEERPARGGRAVPYGVLRVSDQKTRQSTYAKLSASEFERLSQTSTLEISLS
jgi:hypothetical protein